MSPTSTRVLVTGAAGRLGSTVAERFHEEGFEVFATDVVAVDEVPYRFELADLRVHTEAAALLDGIDLVAHIGNHPGIGWRPPQLVFDENVSMNINVFQAAAEQGVGHIIFASTLQMLGSHVDHRTVVTPPERPRFPLTADTPPQPSNLYALSKVVSEEMLRYYAERCGLACTALRLPLLHRHDERILVRAGEERPDDVFEGFTGLTYADAADLFLAVARAGGRGFRVHLVGTCHRHRELAVPELIATLYPDTPAGVADLVDLAPVTAATGWTLGSDYHRADGEVAAPRSPTTRRP